MVRECKKSLISLENASIDLVVEGLKSFCLVRTIVVIVVFKIEFNDEVLVSKLEFADDGRMFDDNMGTVPVRLTSISKKDTGIVP